MTNNEIAFTSQQIDAAYINSLVDLVNACRELDVKIDKVYHQNCICLLCRHISTFDILHLMNHYKDIH